MSLKAQPKLQMPQEHAWGIVVPTGETGIVPEVKVQIPLVNTGSQLLIVRDVRPNCGCTTAPISHDTIPPGDTAVLDVVMKLPAANGLVTKFITVVTNEATDSVHALKLTAQVERPLQLSSAFVPFNTAIVGKPSTGKISITSYSPNSVEINFSTPTTGAIILSPKTTTLRQLQTFEVELTYTPTQEGKFEVLLIMQSKLAGYANVEISGYGVAMAENP